MFSLNIPVHAFGNNLVLKNLSKCDRLAHSFAVVIVYRCDYVAIGNGVGCRDAETFISQLIKERVFAPLEIAYW